MRRHAGSTTPARGYGSLSVAGAALDVAGTGSPARLCAVAGAEGSAASATPIRHVIVAQVPLVHVFISSDPPSAAILSVRSCKAESPTMVKLFRSGPSHAAEKDSTPSSSAICNLTVEPGACRAEFCRASAQQR